MRLLRRFTPRNDNTKKEAGFMEFTRITNRYTSESVVNNLLLSRSKLVNLQEQLSSGKRITKASDDVLASISVVSTNNSLGKIDNYLKNIDNAQGELETSEKALLTTIDSVHTTKELTLQALNASSGPEEMTIINSQIKQIIQQVKDLGNTKFGTKFIFGGLQTEPTPFTSPATGEIQYNGSPDGSHERRIEISDGVTIPVNLSGDSVFGEYWTEDPDGTPASGDEILHQQGLLGTLIALSNELDEASPDKDFIRQQLDSLDTDLQTVLNAQSELGSLSSRLEMTKSNLEDDELNLTKIKSGAEDIDMAKTISELQFQQTALQASLQVSAQVIQPSLLDYM